MNHEIICLKGTKENILPIQHQQKKKTFSLSLRLLIFLNGFILKFFLSAVIWKIDSLF